MIRNIQRIAKFYKANIETDSRTLPAVDVIRGPFNKILFVI